MVSMPTLMEDVRPLVLVEYEFECREKLKLEGFLWKFWIIMILMREKGNEFQFAYSSTSAEFSIEIFLELIELLVSEN